MTLTCKHCGQPCHHRATLPTCTACRDALAPAGVREKLRVRRARTYQTRTKFLRVVDPETLRAKQREAARRYHEKRKTDPAYRKMKADAARRWREARELEDMLR